MALPYMRDSAEGIAPHRPHVINVSSTAGLIAIPFAGGRLHAWRCRMEVHTGRLQDTHPILDSLYQLVLEAPAID